jgi:uncharacterized membrane protein
MFTPVLVAGTGLDWLGAPLMHGWSLFCHQDPGRSFDIHGVQLLACSRCTLIFTGAFAGTLAAPLLGLVGRTRRIAPWILAVGLAPMGVHVALGWLGIDIGGLAGRAVTGGIAGLVGALFILPGLTAAAVELVEYVKRRGPSMNRLEVTSCHRE